jgi:hypothetical protein
MNINNFEIIDSETFTDNNSLDVNYNFTEENEFNDNYVDQNLFKGAHVVLVSENNPWYINKGIPQKYISREFTTTVDDPYGQNMYKYHSYKPKYKLDESLPDLGLGHSILERNLAMKNMGVNQIEGFNGNTKSDKMNRNILIAIIVILLLFYLYNKCK